MPVSRLHPVEGAAARRQAARGIEARQGVGHRVRRRHGRHRQAPRLQEPRRRKADERHRPGRRSSARSITSRAGPRSSTRRRSRCKKGDATEEIGQRRLHDPRARIAADEDSVAVDQFAARPRFDRRARPAGDSEVDAGDRRRLHRPRARDRSTRRSAPRCRSSR